MSLYLVHHGIKGQRWGIHRYQNYDGSLTQEGKKRYYPEYTDRVFVSGTSKMQDLESEYYRKELPKDIRSELDNHVKNNDKILVGDAPGVDSMVQDYLANKKYKNVEIYVSGSNVRKNSDSSGKLGWKVHHINTKDFVEGSKEWHAVKDEAMNKSASYGLAIILENGGASATRKNVLRFMQNQKDVKIFELSSSKPDAYITGQDFLKEMGVIR